MRRERTAPPTVHLLGLPLLALAACSSPNHDNGGQTPVANEGAPAGPVPSQTLAIDVEAACRALHGSRANLWPERLQPIIAAGAVAEPFLIRAFEEAPAADGAQATLAALGRIGGEPAIALCRRLVEERAPLAYEAALALAELPTTKSDKVLLECVADRHSDASLRTAAACALARHGENEQTPRFLAAIVRAGTPAGRADEKELGLPGKSRWARERYFVQRTLRKLGHADLCDALDSDAPWPVLEKLAPKVEARLQGK